MDSETDKQIAIFEGQKIRRHWNSKEEKWYFSVSDVIAVLTNSVDAGAYWRKLKQRLKEEGSEVVTKCHELKFVAKDGKYYSSDAADIKTLLRLIQSVPSPKAEPFKLWLARVGYERMQETVDPERGLNRARQNWQRLGYSEKWISACAGMTLWIKKQGLDKRFHNRRDECQASASS